MKRLLFISFLSVCSILSLKAQEEYSCHVEEDSISYIMRNGNCELVNGGSWDYYKNMNQYIPDLDNLNPLHVPPIKTVRVKR